jgi:hypothetical protein
MRGSQFLINRGGWFLNDIEEIVGDILRVAEQSFDARSVAPKLEELLSLIEGSPERHEEFTNKLLALLDPAPNELQLGRPGIVDILEYCMHRLRWPEMREAMQRLVSTAGDWRVSRAAERVLEAYDDEWPAGEIYDVQREN